MPVLHVAVQNAVSYRYLGVATASMHTFRQMGGTVGIAVMGTAMTNRLRNSLADIQTNPSQMASRSDLSNPQILMDPTKLDELYELMAMFGKPDGTRGKRQAKINFPPLSREKINAYWVEKE